MHISVKNLRDHLSDYLRHVKNGEEVIITSHMKAVAKITPITDEIIGVHSRAELIEDIALLHTKLQGVKLKSTMRDTVVKARNQERS